MNSRLVVTFRFLQHCMLLPFWLSFQHHMPIIDIGATAVHSYSKHRDCASSICLRYLVWAEHRMLLFISVTTCMQVHKLRQQEQDGQQSKPKRPRAVVLGPTRELTDQILQVAKSLSHHARFRSACVNGGAPPSARYASKASFNLTGNHCHYMSHRATG